jgi:hypothetical protein
MTSSWDNPTRCYHINRDHFRWRETHGGVVLVEKQSVVRFWGEARANPARINEPVPAWNSADSRKKIFVENR